MTAAADAAPGDRPTSVDKALRLLQAVAGHDMAGVGVSELARQAGLPKSTAFRLLAALERNGMVERVGTNYRMGRALSEPQGMPSSPLIDLAQTVLTPFLAHLFERTRQTVYLAVLDGADVVFLNKLHGVHRAPSPSRIGGRAPAHCTSLGKAMLAFDPGATDLVCAGELMAWTPHTLTDPDRLRAHLAGVRERRFGTDDEEYLLGVGSVGAPVLTPDGVPVAALCIAGPVQVLTAGYEQPLLQVCAQAGKAYGRARRAAGLV